MAVAVVGSSNAPTSPTLGATSITAAKPTGTASGNLLLAVIAGRNGTAGGDITFTPPTGWTLIGQQLDDDSATDREKLAIFSKVAGGSEPTSYTFTAAGLQDRMALEIVALSGQSTTVALQVALAKFGGAANTVHSTPPMSLGQSAKVITVMADPGGLWTPPTGDTELQPDTMAGLLVSISGTELTGTVSRTATSTLNAGVGVAAAIAVVAAPTVSALAVGSPTYREDYAFVDLQAVTTGGTAPYTFSVTGTGVIQPSAAGRFLLPRSAAGPLTYPYTVTDSGGQSVSGTLTASQLTATIQESMRIRKWNPTTSAWE